MTGRIFWFHKPAPPHLSMVSLFFSPLFFLSPSSSPILSSLEGTLTSGRNHSPGYLIILQCQTLLGRQFFYGEFPQPRYEQGHSLSWLYNFSCSIFVFFYKRILMELNKLRTLVLHHLNSSTHWVDTVGRSGGAVDNYVSSKPYSYICFCLFSCPIDRKEPSIFNDSK